MATVKTSQFKFCPLCSKPLSHTWNEGYCTHTSCLWNAPQCWEKEGEKECTPQAGLVSDSTGSSDTRSVIWATSPILTDSAATVDTYTGVTTYHCSMADSCSLIDVIELGYRLTDEIPDNLIDETGDRIIT